MFLPEVLISKIVDIVGGVVGSDSKLEEIKVKLRQIDIEQYKAELELAKVHKSLVDSLKDVITLTFPVCVWVLILAYFLDYTIQAYCGMVGREAPIIQIQESHFYIVQTFLGALFTTKTLRNGMDNLKEYKISQSKK